MQETPGCVAGTQAPRGTVFPGKVEDALPENGSGRGGTDHELVRRARRGDEVAFEALVDRHAGRLYGLALHLVGNAADAEDVVQDALVGALRGLRGFRGRASVKTWLTAILVKRVARLRRYQRIRKALSIEQAVDQPDAASSDARVEAEQADLRMDVTAVLASLSDDHRNVIVLREMQGMSYEEIAEALAVPRGTVESRLFRARQRLKELLKDYLP